MAQAQVNIFHESKAAVEMMRREVERQLEANRKEIARLQAELARVKADSDSNIIIFPTQQ